MERRGKRQADDDGHGSSSRQSHAPTSLSRSISPPWRFKKARRVTEPVDDEETSSEAEQPQGDDDDDDETSSEAEEEEGPKDKSGPKSRVEEPPQTEDKIPGPPQRIFKSPFQLTKIRDLPPESNVDTVTLGDILGDPLISECWEFNYLHDLDFLMSAFDEDVRHLVQVHVVHGFWKQEDPNRLSLQEASSRYSNVTLHSAFMPEMFGTHHSKMMILLRHDDTAQIVIHTANLIVRDWTNMTQAVWRSPLLPRLATPAQQATADDSLKDPEALQPGSGQKFKLDFLNYLFSYDTRRPTCRSIAEELNKYDFSSIRGSLIASVPGRHNIREDHPAKTRWGWAAMKQTLKSVSVLPGNSAEIAIQISSIATLGPTDNWLKNTLFDAFSGGRSQPVPSSTTPKKSMMGLSQQVLGSQKPEFKIVFPTPNEIRSSLDGYNSGASIHTKIQSAQQKKQLLYLQPMLYHWANDLPPLPSSSSKPDDVAKSSTSDDEETDSGRNRAAPHIKTYIRCGNNSHKTIDWALLTSANLSKQAWGEAVSGAGEVRIASYEIGVLVWPGLFVDDQAKEEGAVMRGTFLRDTPTLPDNGQEEIPDHQPGEDQAGKDKGPETKKKDMVVVGLRMPYSLPLRKYGKDEIPWVATASYGEPDWMGRVWKD